MFMALELLTYIHLVGVALGFGSAMVSDAIFFSTIKDRKISNTEFRFIKLGSRLVWLGIIILACSGIGLFFIDPVRLLHTPKFIAKMSIFSIIIFNGIIFHSRHISHIGAHKNVMLQASTSFRKNSKWLFASGAVSVVSWFSVLLLGSLRNISLTFAHIISIYSILLIFSILIAIILDRKMFR
jgi:hypothetical protein